ncbi:MAG: radical SAM protein [Deltaproteobacteria bacterium]|nr:radical SAM protein [Deltaproteobacteria bacterium]
MALLGYIQVTRICNQRCLFCSNPDNDRVLSVEEALRGARELAASGYDGVILTGGEPTLHPQLARIIAGVREIGIHVRLITNGQLSADLGYLGELKAAGLQHVHVSLHTARAELQASITGKPDSFACIDATLSNLGELDLACDLNTVICAQNADHLDQTAAEIIERHPHVRHFVWNNIDPRMNRVAQNPQTVARLADMELALHRAARLCDSSGRSFRIERVPLCYMADFAHASTETRKIVKGEERRVLFLDEKGEVRQTDFFHQKAEVCKTCSLDPICAGLYDLGGAYDPSELHALFIDPEPIRARILRVP